MHIPFDDFDKVMSKCFEVFTSWDDEYDKLQGLLRWNKKFVVVNPDWLIF